MRLELIGIPILGIKAWQIRQVIIDLLKHFGDTREWADTYWYFEQFRGDIE